MTQQGETTTIIHVSRDRHHYTYSLTRNGEIVVQNQQISRDRATQIIHAHPDEKTDAGKQANFSLKEACSWLWSVEIEETAV